tara:strand:- start:192 stop:629 length:438 start_codon:yes stop_codon:yes gene_type:complete
MKTTIKIQDIEEKVSQKTGKTFIRAKMADGGWITAFEKPHVEAIKVAMANNEEIELELVERGEYTNVQRVYGNVGEQLQVEEVKMVDKEDKYKEAREDKNRSILTSYAKDIYLANTVGLDIKDIHPEDEMTLAIGLVKQAWEAFK